jgi:glucose-6-phosphate 1-dehydrogenase
MYRVDHYLGKPGVMAIGEFRSWHNSFLAFLSSEPS